MKESIIPMDFSGNPFNGKSVKAFFKHWIPVPKASLRRLSPE